MTNIKILILTIFLFVFGLYPIKSQDIHHLDLETTIEIAKRQSPTMLSLMRQVKIASNNLKAALASYKPQINMNLTLPQYSETINKFEDSSGISFYPIRQSHMSSSLSIRQRLPTDGNLSISGNLSNYTDYFTDNRSGRFSTSIGLTQPIAAFFGVNNYKISLKQTRLSYDRSIRSLQRQELDLVYIVSQSFYELLSAREQMKIADLNYAKQQEAYEIAKSKHEAGLLREVEALQMEVDLVSATNTFENRKTTYKNQIRFFKETIGIEPLDSIVLLNEMEYIPVNIDAKDAVNRALKYRNELQESEIQIEINEMNLRKLKASGRISGSIGVNYNFNGSGSSTRSDPFYYTFQDTWMNLIERPGGFGIGVSAQIPLLDWGANKARVNSAESSLEQNRINLKDTKRKIEREILSLIDNLNNSLRGLQIMEKSIIIAEKSFDISRQRYANDEIDSQSMALERERLNRAYTSHLTSYINYKLGLSDLMRKTFFDYEKNKPVVEDIIQQ